jgi:hypothetical protein
MVLFCHRLDRSQASLSLYRMPLYLLFSMHLKLQQAFALHI